MSFTAPPQVSPSTRPACAGGFDLELAVEIVPGRIDGNAPADFAVERDMIGARLNTYYNLPVRQRRNASEFDERAATGVPSWVTLHMPFAGAIIFDSRSHSFGRVVRSSPAAALENFFEGFDAGRGVRDGRERDQVGEDIIQSSRLGSRSALLSTRTCRGIEHFSNSRHRPPPGNPGGRRRRLRQ